jgi:hypothetical membrane protein
VRLLALGGVAGPLLFTSLAVLCGALRPEYSHATQFLSELGESGGSHASLMNLLGFVPTGLLLAAFAASLASVLPRTALSLAAALLIALFGLGMVGAGVYHCDPGCPTRDLSPEGARHQAISGSAFLAAILGMGVFALCFRRLPAWRRLWLYSALSSAAALALVVVLSASMESRWLAGVWQRLFLGTLFLWCGVVGLTAFRAPRVR